MLLLWNNKISSKYKKKQTRKENKKKKEMNYFNVVVKAQTGTEEGNDQRGSVGWGSLSLCTGVSNPC